MPPAGRTLVEPLRDRAGTALRAVGYHEADAWDVAYLRDDLQRQYGDADKDDIARDLVMTGLSGSRQEALYGLGELEATVRLFDHGLVVHVPADEQSGYFVSLDGDADVRGRQVVDLVRRTAGLA
jgi:hypothetical protein